MTIIKLYLEIRVGLNHFFPLEKVFVESEAKISRASGTREECPVVIDLTIQRKGNSNSRI